jgi:hypothetical protein
MTRRPPGWRVLAYWGSDSRKAARCRVTATRLVPHRIGNMKGSPLPQGVLQGGATAACGEVSAAAGSGLSIDLALQTDRPMLLRN